MILTHLVLLKFFSGASSGEAVEEEVIPRPGAGRSKHRKRRRYELPDGLHVYATVEEALALAQEFLGQSKTVVVEKKKKKLVIPEVNIVLDDGEMPYIQATKQKTPNSADAFIAFTQKAELDAIAYENILEHLRRRRRIKAFLLSA